MQNGDMRCLQYMQNTRLRPRQRIIDLYASVGWTPPLPEQIETALRHSDLTVSVMQRRQPIGMGRVIGDGAISYFVKDVAGPARNTRAEASGRLMMNAILDYIRATVPAGLARQPGADLQRGQGAVLRSLRLSAKSRATAWATA